MTTVKNVPIHLIDPNRYRDPETYPVLRPKVDALKSSIATVGMWPSIIVRESKGRYEQAFGVSRLTAARELDVREVPVIIDNTLTDKQMVQYMGRENSEDYGSDVQVALNTWEAGFKFSARAEKAPKDIAIAQLLGWLEPDGRMNLLARTCSAAFKLINAGHLSRDDLAGIPVSAAFNVVERVVSRMEMIERNAKATGTSPQQRERIKTRIVKAGKTVIGKVREGKIAARDVRHEVDVEAYLDSRGTKDELPMFRTFGKTLTDQLDRMLRADAAAEKLQQVVSVLSQVTQEEDKSIIRQIGFDLGEVAARAKLWQAKLDGKKVVKLAEIGRSA